jgi:hypothetical protein
MAKKALLVGVNAYSSSPLNGCVNDIRDMEEVLRGLFGYEETQTLVDENATTAGIKVCLTNLLMGLVPGDSAVFHFSGHGCFAGDTRVPLLDGTCPTMKELAAAYRDSGFFWVYSMTRDGKVVPGKAHSARMTKIDTIVELELDNGEVVRCTPDHLFMLRGGRYVRADCLKPGASLMPLYRRLSEKVLGDRLDGYEMCFVPSQQYIVELREKRIEDSKDGYIYTHRLVGNALGMIPDGYKGVLHHRDFRKVNNTPENLEFLSRRQHALVHMWTPDRRAISRLRAIKRNKEYNWPEHVRAKVGEISSKNRKQEWKSPAYRKKIVAGLKRSFVGCGNDDPRIVALHEARPKSHTPTATMKKLASFRQTAADPKSKFYKRVHSAGGRRQFSAVLDLGNHVRWHVNRGLTKPDCEFCGVINHKVVAVRQTAIKVPVYDITVEKYHNFALAAGVFVHNSQVPDQFPFDEADRLDECICPVNIGDGDYWEKGVITDDWLSSALKNVLPGVKLTVLLDSCHSGSGTRGGNGIRPPSDALQAPAPRYLSCPKFNLAEELIGRLHEGRSIQYRRMGSGKNNKTFKKLNHALLSGCRSNQTSADAWINGRYNGAFTHHLLKVVRKNPIAQLVQVMNNTRELLHLEGYEQVPQLESDPSRFTEAIF